MENIRAKSSTTEAGRWHPLIHYHGRGDHQHSQRILSPERITPCRDNWCLDVRCHRAKDMYSFALDRISHPGRDPDPIRSPRTRG